MDNVYKQTQTEKYTGNLYSAATAFQTTGHLDCVHIITAACGRAAKN
jgi:hypothetical protein